METNWYTERLKALPERPGVYLFKDEGGAVLYVGKAAVLRHRVRSYFQSPADLSPRTSRLMERVTDFEFFVTDSEQEAILLECNLIKKHRPFFNVRLKDDKSYPYLKVSLDEEWPRIYVTRRVDSNRARYFGPYASAGSVRQTLDLIQKLFPFRSCQRSLAGRLSRPCLEYHIKRCIGPCTGKVSRREYLDVVKQVLYFLEGKEELIVKQLQRKMDQASEEMEYERAAYLRDQIRAVTLVTERQKISWTGMGDRDAIAFIQMNDQTLVMVFFIRRGKLVGKEHFVLTSTQEEQPEHIMSSFVKQYYNFAVTVPPLALLQHPVDETLPIEKWLAAKRGGRVRLLVPGRGKNRELIAMVEENARQTLEQLRVKFLVETDTVARGLHELKEKLGLPEQPKRIECYDISDIQGALAVGSMVVFENGYPKKEHYRRFKIKTVTAVDDYAMIKEVLRRRLKRGSDSQGDPWGMSPSLLLIDGGKGHLNAALEVVNEAGLSLPVASLAKENEEVFLPGRSGPADLPRTSAGLYLLQRIRDEAHRFALGYHGRLRQKRGIASALDSVPGIGPKRKKALLRRFGSVKAIKEASAEEIASVPGINRSVTARIKEHL
ncbi:MAG: excinuclease ABC subunit UvrC [Chloroflexi bacterium]|nr:excinuclease ABC subunit UvrC [Chloroflexota bacterium]